MRNINDQRYDVILTITDKQMKKGDGDERVSFEETAEVSSESPDEARLMAKYLAGEIWSTDKYDIEVKSCKVKEVF